MTDADAPQFAIEDDARTALDRYLDDVDAALKRNGDPRSERLAVCEEIEAHVLETLAGRCDHTATRTEIQSVLAELDPPDAYCHSESQPQQTGPDASAREITEKPSGFAIAAFAVPVLAVVSIPLSSLAEGPAIAGFVFAQVLAILLVWIGREPLRKSQFKADRRFAVSGLCLIPMVALTAWTVWTTGDRLEAAYAPVPFAKQQLQRSRDAETQARQHMNVITRNLESSRSGWAAAADRPDFDQSQADESIAAQERALAAATRIYRDRSQQVEAQRQRVIEATNSLWQRYTLATFVTVLQAAVVVAVGWFLAKLGRRWLAT